MKLTIVFISLFLGLFSLHAQIPHLTGEIKISIQSGTIDATLKLINLPKSDNYAIWLNSGLNIEYFRHGDDTDNYDYDLEYVPERSFEAFQYYFPSTDNKHRYLPDSFLVKYTGKYPVIRDTTRAYQWGDWKGNIAFNGQTLRASEQCAWYPILYDIDKDLVINSYTYDLTVNCIDCESMYVNGFEPVNQSQATFVSETAVALLLFAGAYDFIKQDGITFLNTQLTEAKQKSLADWTNKIIHFYEEKLQMPYGQSVSYISTSPVSKKNEWMFVTYPTIASIGIDKYKLEAYFDDETAEIKDASNITFFAHELGHYYLGTVFVPNGSLRWVFLEGLTDYLSILASKYLIGEAMYQSRLSMYAGQIAQLEPIPLSRIESANEISETYRYRYVPLLLTAIEKEIGEAQMWIWVQRILASDGEISDFDFLKRSLLESGVSEKKLQFLIESYIDDPEAKQNVLEKVKG